MRERSRKISSSVTASLTVESAISVTIFLVFAVSFCQIFFLMQTQIRLQRVLEQVSNEAASYSYISSQVPIWDSDSRLISEIEDYLLIELSEKALELRFCALAGEYLDNSSIKNGADGVSLSGSSILEDNHWIRLELSYRVNLPISFFGFDSVPCTQHASRYAWLGDAEPMAGAVQTEQMVYVTETGEVYHTTLDCTYLNLSVRAVDYSSLESLRNDSGGKYYPCEKCSPAASGTVYITASGSRYHSSSSCSSLTRNVTAVPVSEVGDRRPCSRCGDK